MLFHNLINKNYFVMNALSAVIPFVNIQTTSELARRLNESGQVEEIFIYSAGSSGIRLPNCRDLIFDYIQSSASLQKIADCLTTEYLLLCLRQTEILLMPNALETFIKAALESNAGIVYSDFRERKLEKTSLHPTCNYQLGSVRDDFDFGPIIVVHSKSFKDAVESFRKQYRFAGLYDMRLKISQTKKIQRIPEPLYYVEEIDFRKPGEKQFEYVNPKNRNVQIEMESVFTDHLKRIGAFLKPSFCEVDLKSEDFEFEASVIIPVKNRLKTIGDAISSALKQKTDFQFNIIVVDNHSNDGTTELLKKLSAENEKIIHIIPGREDLLIGGCWSEAMNNSLCGRFSIQLDSDDIYKDETTLQRIVDTFKKERCGMVIGSYTLTDFYLNEIPPGLIDHREWSTGNGPNNALRINGLGAPRAFYTPLLRKIDIPNVSYGEDYFLGLIISRDYKIGRIYDSIYYCRRWEGNTDAELDINKLNAHNLYKDSLRTNEIWVRQKKNQKNGK